MARSAEAKVKITGDPKGALTAIDRVKGGLNSLSATAARLPGFTALGAAVAGAFSVSAIREIANTADALAKLERRTGITVESLSAYQYAAELSGASTEEFASAIDRLNRNIAQAGDGMATPVAAFAKLGVAATNADGSLRDTQEVLEEVMQAFSEMPEGPERAAIAMDLFGRSGAKLASFLDLGTEGMRKMREEAERLGIVFSAELAASAEQFNDNVVRINKSLDGLKVSVGNKAIPVLAELTEAYLDAEKAGLSLWQRLNLKTDAVFFNPAKELAELREQMAGLNKERSEASTYQQRSEVDEEIADLKRLIVFYEGRNKAINGGTDAADPSGAQAAASKKLLELEKQLGAERVKMARGVATETKQSNTEQIKGAEKLRTALQKAWAETVKGAKAAGEEAANLLKQAKSGQDDFYKQAAGRRRQDLPAEDQQAEIVSQARGAADDANFYAAAAEVAAIDGRAKAAHDYAVKAKELIKEAADAANQVQDNETAAQILERLGDATKAALTAESKLKSGEQAALSEQAASQQAEIEKVAQTLATLKGDAANIPLVVDTDAAKARIAELQAAIAALKKEAASVPINAGGATGSFDASGGGTSGASGGFARGGFTGWRGESAVAGVVHGREFVTRAGVTMQPGAIQFLEDFNRRGMAALREWVSKLPGYRTGGLVGNLRVPQVRAPAAAPAGASNTPVVLDFGSLGRYQASASAREVAGIEQALRRESLRSGRR